MISRTTKLLMAGTAIVVSLFFIIIMYASELASEADAPETTSAYTP